MNRSLKPPARRRSLVRLLCSFALFATGTLLGCGDVGEGDSSDASTRGSAEALTSPGAIITQFPLAGDNARAWVINNYVDLDPTAGLMDYTGKTGIYARTYDGHAGIDMDVPSFRAMDNNVAVVYAAAPGKVVEVVGDQFDRNVAYVAGARPNYVRIRHASGYTFSYLHLKRNSIRVSLNQVVEAGTPLAVVGSSGLSTQPHLHLEVWAPGGSVVDTLTLGMWASPPVHAPPSDVMGVMLRADGAPSDIQIKDPSPDPTSIQRGGVLGVGLSVAGRKNDVFEARLSVANVEGKSVTWTLTDPNHFGHWYRSGQIPVGSKPGAATLTILVNGVTRMTRTFQVI